MATVLWHQKNWCRDIAAQFGKLRGAMQDLKLVADTRIGSAEFGDYHYTEFLKWSFGDRQSKAALLRNLAAARTDANQELLDRKIDYYASLYKLAKDELIERIRLADESNISVAKLHQTLAAEAGLDPKQVRQYSGE